MAREQLQTLTEPMYYILLSMQEESCGVDIMRKVESISKGRIKVGAGTLYGLLDKFLMAGIIQETKVEGRKRSYIITLKGMEMLRKEYERLAVMIKDGEQVLKEI
ncbi:MAG: helix-turn-helix transcriptional regulator [Lachnospiraceae bacterium]|nr:helix-turn-helix transcriptional regulator [Lachnospiraceae bacterium]